MNTRRHILVKGIVQGVGFRPFIYNLAHSHDLAGWVLNSSEGVHIEVEGDSATVETFISNISAKAPPMAKIESVDVQEVAAESGRAGTFVIRHSEEQEGAYQLVSPDISICDDCLAELFDPNDRRYLYPFINCTNCGPRFTIIKDIPYDRPKTTMRAFTMCPECQAEYDDPTNRRFHAQPNACPVCGPSLTFVKAPTAGAAGRSGRSSEADRGVSDERGTDAREAVTAAPLDLPDDPIEATVAALEAGRVVAIKGLGGFHLACDATSEEAVTLLRKRKRRFGKPLAVMMDSLETIERYCHVNDEEREILTSPQRPIVLLEKKVDLAPSVAPGNNYLGVMLPYTPLHYVILRTSGMVLVMTSGNLSEEPIAMENEEGLRRLGHIADYFLLHNREIYSRYDDSVVRVIDGEMHFVRRARGFAPFPIHLPQSGDQILAVGPELKNTFCLTKENYAFVSQHIGDMENAETLEHFTNTLALYKRLFRIEPTYLAHDLHPEYLSTKFAMEQDLPKVGVQHHHAHAAGVMIEHDEHGPVIGVSFDGTGFGTDGQIWGGEFLLATRAGFERAAHLRYVPMPGGAAAIEKPYRMAFGYLYSLIGPKVLNRQLPLFERIQSKELELMRQMIGKGINCPYTSSAGRLFDAVSSILGVRDVADYEGQAAIELEMLADFDSDDAYEFEVTLERPGVVSSELSEAANETISSEVVIVDPTSVLARILQEADAGVPVGTISTRFHNGAADLICTVCRAIRHRTKADTVTLSGGVFQNAYLLGKARRRLEQAGFKVLLHKEVPPNDGCISLGQATVAQARHPG